MSLIIQTEVNLDMTVRITGRDQVTGADIGKLNALIEAIESLGGTINYPNPTTPATPDFINCTFDGYTLTYTGGVFDFNDGHGAVPALVFPFNLMPINVIGSFSFSKSAYQSFMICIDDGSTPIGIKNSQSLFISQSNEASATTGEIQVFKNDVLDQSIDISALTDFRLNLNRIAEQRVSVNVKQPNFQDIGNPTTMEDLNIQRGWLAVKLTAVNSVFSINTSFEVVES